MPPERHAPAKHPRRSTPPLPAPPQSAMHRLSAWPRAPVAQLDRALPSEGKRKLFLLIEGGEKIERNQAIGKTRRKHENRVRGRGSTTEANRKEVVEYERRRSTRLEPASFEPFRFLNSRLTQLDLEHYLNIDAPVAQLDRAPPSEGGGHTFESCRARQISVYHAAFPRFWSQIGRSPCPIMEDQVRSP